MAKTAAAKRVTAQPEPDQQPPDRRQIIEIRTLAPERPFATIDDVRHDFRLLQDFGAREHYELTQQSRRYDELWNRGELEEAEHNERDELLDRLFEKAFVDPTAVREQLGERLTGVIKRELFVTFTDASSLLSARAQLLALAEEITAENGSSFTS